MRYLILLCVVSSMTVSAQVRYKDVEPVIKVSCLSCHSAATPLGGVNLGSYDEVRDHLVSGDADQSDIWVAIASGRMPMGKRLDPKDKKLIKDWINGGAL